MSVRVWTTDLLTGRKLCHNLPISIDSYATGLTGPGTLTGTVPLDAPEDPCPLLLPRRTALWVDEGGAAPSWGGIVWDVDPDIPGRALRVSCSGPFSYLFHREIRETLTFVGVDQVDVVRAVLTWVQRAKSYSDIHLGLLGPASTGRVRDRTYWGYEATKAGDAISKLSQVADGFDLTETYFYDERGAPGWALSLGYPTLGRRNSEVLFVHDQGGMAVSNVKTYSWPLDGTSSANSWLDVGAGEGQAMLLSLAEDPTEWDAGYPRLDGSTMRKDVSVRATLDAHATEDLRVSLGDRVAPTVTLEGDNIPPTGAFDVGDTCRFRLTSVFHRSPRPGTAGLDTWMRIIKRQTKPQTATQMRQVVLTLAPLRTIVPPTIEVI